MGITGRVLNDMLGIGGDTEDQASWEVNAAGNDSRRNDLYSATCASSLCYHMTQT